jgi:hypothetical protein
MTNPPQQPGGWQDPSWPPPEQQQPPQQPYGDQYGGAPVSPGYSAYPAPAGSPVGYPGYGAPPASPSNNGMAIASLIVSIVGAAGLCGYGLGGYLGIVGAILGHVARRQIRQRGEAGAGMALAGVIIGWIAAAIAVIATIIIVFFVVYVASHPDTFPKTT